MIEFIYFLAAIFIAFYLPGRFFLKNLSLTRFQLIVLGTLLGLVLWGWQGFIFGYLHVRWLSYIYLVVFFVLWVREVKFSFKKKRIFFNIDYIAALLIFLGSAVQLTAVWFVGTQTSHGLYFCCGNTGDNTLYIAITNEIVNRFPPFEPGMSGIYLQNYHYWASLVSAELIRVFHLPLIPTLFKFLMLFLSIFLGFSIIVFGQLLKLPKVFYRWFLFFIYFGGDVIPHLLLLLGNNMLFSMSSLEDGAKFLANAPRAFAVVLFFAGLSLFLLWIRKREWKVGVIMGLVLGSLVGFKVYVGFFALSGLSILSVYYFYKKQYKFLLYIAIAFVIALIMYLPVNRGAGGLYYTGLWRFENFISQPALGLISFEMARQIFIQHNNWLKIWLYEGFYILLYLVAIFGTKLLGFFQTKKSLSFLPKELHILFIVGLLVSFIIGAFFQQTSGQANTFNFLASIFIFGTLYSALACMFWGRFLPRKIAYAAACIVILLTIPRVAYEAWHNLDDIVHKKGLLISRAEVNGMKFLKERTSPNALLIIDNRNFLDDNWSPYITFLADRPVFLSGIGNELDAHGIDYQSRKEDVDVIFQNPNAASVAAILEKNKINYILMKKNNYLISTESAKFIDTVFENEFMRVDAVSSIKIKSYIKYNK